LELIGKQIKFNPNLTHLDLSSTGLTSQIIHGLGKTLRRSRSLLSVHLSENPGLTAENKRYITKRIKARPNEDIERFSRI
jgi:hypothetical protein